MGDTPFVYRGKLLSKCANYGCKNLTGINSRLCRNCRKQVNRITNVDLHLLSNGLVKQFPDLPYKSTATGYLLVQQIPGGPWKAEHRMVMEDQLGRTLEPYETVQHKNGKRFDNRPENLELWIGTRKHGIPVSALEGRLVDQANRENSTAGAIP